MTATMALARVHGLLLAACLSGVGVAGETPPIAGARTLLVVHDGDGTVALLDARSGKRRGLIDVGEGPGEIAVSPSGRLAAVSLYGDRDRPGREVVLIDVAQAVRLKTILLDEHVRPHGLAWRGEGEVVVTAGGTAELLVVDVASGEIRNRIGTSQRGSHMVAVTADGSRGYVANSGSGTVTVSDLGEEGKLGDIRVGGGADGIAITPDGHEIWIANRASDTLSVIDAETRVVAATIPCPGSPARLAFTPDGRRAIVVCARRGEIAAIDVAARTEIRRRALKSQVRRNAGLPGATPFGVVVAPSGGLAWVATGQGDVVALIDTTTLEPRKRVRTGREPAALAWSAIEVARRTARRRKGDRPVL